MTRFLDQNTVTLGHVYAKDAVKRTVDENDVYLPQ